MSPRAAVTTIFLLNGAGFAAWAARIPAVEHRLSLGEGGLALVLGAIAGGALVGMPLAGRILARRGSRGPTRAYLLAFTLLLAVVSAAPSAPALIGVAFLFGAAGGGLDVTMNAQGVAVERRIGRPVLASMHAAWSVGGLVGAGLAAVAAAAGLDVRVHLLAVAGVIAVAGTRAGMALLPAAADAPAPSPGEKRRGRPERPAGPARVRLLILGTVAFCSLLAEGAAADWSAVYVNDSLGASEAVAALAFTSYAFAMTLSRLVADRIGMAVGPVALVRAGAILGAAGLGLALLVGHPAAALAGFACLGAGVAPVIPLVFRAAGSLPTVAPGPALARTSTTGYLGLLAGPPLIGALAEATSLPLALGAVVASVALCAVLARAVAIDETRAAVPAPAPA